MEFQLSRKLATQLLNHARQSPTHSVFGIIATKNGAIVATYPVETQTWAGMTASDLTTHINDNEQPIAVYQSHPNSAAEPKDHDLDAFPELIHCYISLNTKGVLELRAFKRTNECVEEIKASLVV